jgi:hypothetical protein
MLGRTVKSRITRQVAHSREKSPHPLPSTRLRACFFKERLKFYRKIPPLKKGSCEKIAFASNCTLEIPLNLPLQKGGKIRRITRYLFLGSLPSPFEKGGQRGI